MALKDFNQMCVDFVNDVGILGGVFATVEGVLTGEALDVKRWIQESDLYIQGLYWDWSWLHATDTGILTQDSDALPRASDLQTLKRDTVVLGKGTSEFHRVAWMNYPEFFQRYELDVKDTNDTPTNLTQSPDYTAGFLLSENIETAAVTYYYEYWKRPVKMLLNADTSAMQPYDEESARIIIARAKMWYAEKEDAPEIMAGAVAEYEDKLQRLRSIALPGQRGSFMGSSQDQVLEVVAQ